MNITGAEWLDFLSDDSHWGKRTVDDLNIAVNGEIFKHHDDTPLKKTDTIEIKYGYVFEETDDGEEPISLEGFFKKWRMKQNYYTLVIQIPKNKLDLKRFHIKEEFKKHLSDINGKIISIS